MQDVIIEGNCVQGMRDLSFLTTACDSTVISNFKNLILQISQQLFLLQRGLLSVCGKASTFSATEKKMNGLPCFVNNNMTWPGLERNDS